MFLYKNEIDYLIFVFLRKMYLYKNSRVFDVQTFVFFALMSNYLCPHGMVGSNIQKYRSSNNKYKT